uniref:Uncharacterized protein n=1 Tax=Romanomermis culicivorax TaxID=13658 RepID=A0A915KF58_ROMCU
MGRPESKGDDWLSSEEAELNWRPVPRRRIMQSSSKIFTTVKIMITISMMTTVESIIMAFRHSSKTAIMIIIGRELIYIVTAKIVQILMIFGQSRRRCHVVTTIVGAIISHANEELKKLAKKGDVQGDATAVVANDAEALYRADETLGHRVKSLEITSSDVKPDVISETVKCKTHQCAANGRHKSNIRVAENGSGIDIRYFPTKNTGIPKTTIRLADRCRSSPACQTYCTQTQVPARKNNHCTGMKIKHIMSDVTVTQTKKTEKA